jgi:hypothetical protein
VVVLLKGPTGGIIPGRLRVGGKVSAFHEFKHGLLALKVAKAGDAVTTVYTDLETAAEESVRALGLVPLEPPVVREMWHPGVFNERVNILGLEAGGVRFVSDGAFIRDAGIQLDLTDMEGHRLQLAPGADLTHLMRFGHCSADRFAALNEAAGHAFEQWADARGGGFDTWLGRLGVTRDDLPLVRPVRSKVAGK